MTSPKSPSTLAVCAGMLLKLLPIVERLKRISSAGFQAKIWDWTERDSKALAASGAALLSITGIGTGTFADDDGADELLRTAMLSVPIAKEINRPRLNLHGTGLDCRGLPIVKSMVTTPAMWLKAHDTPKRVATVPPSKYALSAMRVTKINRKVRRAIKCRSG